METCPICGKHALFLIVLDKGPAQACVDHVGTLIADSGSPYAPVINLTAFAQTLEVEDAPRFAVHGRCGTRHSVLAACPWDVLLRAGRDWTP